MRLLDPSILEKNPNVNAGISSDTLTALRIGGCQYIADSRFNLQQIHLKMISSAAGSQVNSMKYQQQMELNMLPYTVQNVAMLYYNMFFLKKCYLNYNRETVMNTCIMIAAKQQNMHELNLKYLVTNQIQMRRFIDHTQEIHCQQ
jgi:hypothetical protein